MVLMLPPGDNWEELQYSLVFSVLTIQHLQRKYLQCLQFA